VLRAAGTQSEVNATLDALRIRVQARRSGAAMVNHALRRLHGWIALDATYRALGATDAVDDKKLILAAHMDVRGRVCARKMLC
jgi:hypothetical protein